MDFQSEKSFGKLRLTAFQPYHHILYMLKHVKFNIYSVWWYINADNMQINDC